MTGTAGVTALLGGKLDMLYFVPPQSIDRIARAKGRASCRGRSCARLCSASITAWISWSIAT